MQNIYFYLLGGVFALLGVVSYFFPRLAVSKAVEAEFNGRERIKKKYLLHVSIHLFLVGAALFVAGLLPNHLKERVTLAIMLIIFISSLWGNKRHLGRWFAWKL